MIFCEFLFLIFACRDLLGRLSWIVFVRGLGRPREPCETFRSLSVLSMKEPTKTVKFTTNSSKSFLWVQERSISTSLFVCFKRMHWRVELHDKLPWECHDVEIIETSTLFSAFVCWPLPPFEHHWSYERPFQVLIWQRHFHPAVLFQSIQGRSQVTSKTRQMQVSLEFLLN